MTWEVPVGKKTPAPVPVPVAATFATIQAARASGATAGTLLAAPLAPATGPIAGVPESMVVVTVKSFWQSPTWTAIKAVLASAAAIVVITLGGAFTAVWAKSQSIFTPGAIDWRATEIACEISGGGVLVAGVMAWARKYDNNAVK
jgi:hypothetical protein